MKLVAFVAVMLAISAESARAGSPTSQPISIETMERYCSSLRAENSRLKSDIQKLQTELAKAQTQLAQLATTTHEARSPSTQPVTTASPEKGKAVFKHLFAHLTDMTLEEAERVSGAKARLIEGDAIRSRYRLSVIVGDDNNVDMQVYILTVRASDSRITDYTID